MAEPTTTAKYIFDQSIKLMDEQSDSGDSVWSDTVEYQHRAVAILNTLIGECYPYSDTYTVNTPGKRPIPKMAESLTDVVYLDDSLCKTVLPYGLAAELMKNDDPALGNYFLQRYQELLARHSRTIPAAWDTIEDVYGCIDPVSFGRW